MPEQEVTEQEVTVQPMSQAEIDDIAASADQGKEVYTEWYGELLEGPGFNDGRKCLSVSGNDNMGKSVDLNPGEGVEWPEVGTMVWVGGTGHYGSRQNADNPEVIPNTIDVDWVRESVGDSQ